MAKACPSSPSLSFPLGGSQVTPVPRRALALPARAPQAWLDLWSYWSCLPPRALTLILTAFSCPHLRIFSPLRLPPVGKWGGDPSESPDSHRARHPLNSEPLPLPRCPFILVPQPAGNHGSLASPQGLAKKKTPKQCFLHFPRQHGGVIARRLRRFADTK